MSPYIEDYLLLNRYTSSVALPLSFTDSTDNIGTPIIRNNDVRSGKFNRPSITSFPLQSDNDELLTIAVYNLFDDEDEIDYTTSTWKKIISRDKVKVVIIGGGGFVEPDVRLVDRLLEVYPGVYGEYVLNLAIWVEPDSGISSFQWEAIPTEAVLPDSSFNSIIETFYAPDK